MDVMVNYRNGVMMSYSLHSFMPWEGYVVTFNGVKGRIEHICQETVYFSGDGSVPGELKPEGTKTKVYLHAQPAYEVELWQSEGGHGGADPVMIKDLFDPHSPPDKYKRAADYRSGAWSILTGVAANHSMASGKPIRIDNLIHGLADPDYPPMPTATDPLEALAEKSAAPGWFKKENSEQ